MKKIIFASAVLLLAVSCHKTPSPIDRDGEYLVYTSRSEEVDFKNFRTYNIPDSILVIGQSPKPEYSKSSFAKGIVDEYKKMMNSCGYTYAERESADIGIQVTYMVDTDRYVSYVPDSYWWLDYPGYWYPGYWGGWYGWRYAYPVVYSYSTNSLVTEMVDLTAEEGDGSLLPVIWTSYIGGEKGSNSYYELQRMKLAIGQSFSQSGYLDLSAE